MKTPRKSGAYRLLVTMAIVIMLIIVLAEVVWIIGNSNSDTKTDGTDLTADQTADQTGTDQSGEQAAEADLAAEWNTKVKAAIKEYDTYNGENATRIPVLTYHMVVTDEKKSSYKYSHTGAAELAVSKSTFEEQMKWLKDRGYRTINCMELYLWHEGKIKLPKESVLITFDDGAIGVATNALPILKKYKTKATIFIVGSRTKDNESGTISYNRVQKIKREYSNIEFQSHTYKLHKNVKHNDKAYEKVLKDARKQDEYFDFNFLAYPYGHNFEEMRNAYRDSGIIKMAFTYDKEGGTYATIDQDIYQIERIKVNANESLSKFTSWFE